MQFSPGEVRAISFIHEKHPKETLTATILLEGGIGFMCVSVTAGTEARPERRHYITSPNGKVWTSSDGHTREDLIRKGDSEKHEARARDYDD